MVTWLVGDSISVLTAVIKRRVSGRVSFSQCCQVSHGATPKCRMCVSPPHPSNNSPARACFPVSSRGRLEPTWNRSTFRVATSPKQQHRPGSPPAAVRHWLVAASLALRSASGTPLVKLPCGAEIYFFPCLFWLLSCCGHLRVLPCFAWLLQFWGLCGGVGRTARFRGGPRVVEALKLVLQSGCLEEERDLRAAWGCWIVTGETGRRLTSALGRWVIIWWYSAERRVEQLRQRANCATGAARVTHDGEL